MKHRCHRPTVFYIAKPVADIAGKSISKPVNIIVGMYEPLVWIGEENYISIQGVRIQISIFFIIVCANKGILLFCKEINTLLPAFQLMISIANNRTFFYLS